MNLLHYKANYQDPLPVTVKVERLNPKVNLVYYGEHFLTGVGHELTALRFSLDAEGNVIDLNQLPKSLVTQSKAQQK